MHLDKTQPLKHYTSIHAIYTQRADKVKRYLPLIWGEASIEDIDRLVDLVNEIIEKNYSWVEKI